MPRDPQLRVRTGPPLKAALRATAREGEESPTLRLNALAERYLAIVEAERPALSRAEWMAIFDANNGYGLMEEIQSADGSGGAPNWEMLWANVADMPRLRGLSVAQKIAVAETVQRFWALAHLSDSQALDLATSHPATWPDE